MITLTYPEKDAQVEAIEQQIQDLSLAFQYQVNKKVKQVQLQDGNTLVEGSQKIELYLEEISKELNQWYYCSC